MLVDDSVGLNHQDVSIRTMPTKSPSPHEVLFQANPPGIQAQLEYEFFARVSLPNGTFKTTGSRRLQDINNAAESFIQEFSSPTILDVAVSSGATTVEWHDSLRNAGISFQLTATDLCVWATLWVPKLGKSLAAIANARHDILHLTMFGEGWPPQQQVKPGIPARCLRLVCLAAFRAGMAVTPWLFDRTAIALMSKGLAERNIPVIEDDLTKDNPKDFRNAFDVIRAANILNKNYFPDVTLIKMLANLRGRLKPNGILIVGRTWDDGTNHASVYRRSESGLLPLACVGTGSEIDGLIAKLDPAPSPLASDQSIQTCVG